MKLNSVQSRWIGAGVLSTVVLAGLAVFTAPDEPFVHFSWTVWHENVRLFDDTYPGSLREIDLIRNEAVGKQSHNSGAAAQIRNTTNNELRALAYRTREHVYTVWKLEKHFRWVAFKEKGQREAFRSALASGDFAKIRTTYENGQSHNPNAHYLLAAVSNYDLKLLIDNL